jgi:hypothetical protein
MVNHLALSVKGNTMSLSIPVGTSFVSLHLERWVKHGRKRFMVLILCDDDPFSDYDALRDMAPTLDEVKSAVDWIISNENQGGMAGYTDAQLEHLREEIGKLVSQ